MKNKTYDTLVALLSETETMRMEAEIEHSHYNRDSNPDLIYYQGGAKLEILEKIIPALEKIIKEMKNDH
jgi:hypothetical protein